MKTVSTFPLRLPHSIKAAVQRVSREDGTSMNQFVATAVAEKLAVMETERFFQKRSARADLKKFDELMDREGGAPAQDGDQA